MITQEQGEILSKIISEVQPAHNGTPYPNSIPGGVIATLSNLKDVARPIVKLRGEESDYPFSAHTIIPLKRDDVGKKVVMIYESQDQRRPIVIGLIQESKNGQDVIQVTGPELTAECKVRLDGERLLIEAHKEVVLQCGKASITLTRTGKIIIRGTYLVSRSSGVNKIQGASIQLN